MATTYTHADRLILERWDEVTELIAAREELEDKIDEVVEAVGDRLRRWLEPQGYLLDTKVKDVQFHVCRKTWEDRRRGKPVYFVLGAFAPEGYRRCDDQHPFLWLFTETLDNFRLRTDDKRAFAADLRKSLGPVAADWMDDDCDDENAPIGMYLRDVDNRARCALVSSPEKLYDFAVQALPKLLGLADVVEAAVNRALKR